MGKLGKAVDKAFTHACPTDAKWDHPLDKNALKQAIAQHLFRHGRFEVGEAYCASTADRPPNASSSSPLSSYSAAPGTGATTAGVVGGGVGGGGAVGGTNNSNNNNNDDLGGHHPHPASHHPAVPPVSIPGVPTTSQAVVNAMKAPFLQTCAVAAEIETNRNLAPLAKWIDDHRAELVAANNGGPIPLEFMLHKLRFMSLLVGDGDGGGAATATAREGEEKETKTVMVAEMETTVTVTVTVTGTTT